MKLSLLECLALATATATQRARALKRLIDEEIESPSFSFPSDYDCDKWSIERWVHYFLDSVYTPQNAGERAWLCRRLVSAYSKDRSRRKLLMWRVKALVDARAATGMHSHSIASHTHSISFDPSYAHAHTFTTNTAWNHSVNYQSWRGTIMP